MRDRFMTGLIIGSISGVISSAMDLILVKILGFGDMAYIDFAGIIFLGDKVKSFYEGVYCQVIQAVYSGFLGVVFGYLIIRISFRYYRIKGIILGLWFWFFTHAIAHLFKMHQMIKMRLDTSVENALISIIFGYLMAEIYRHYFYKLQ